MCWAAVARVCTAQEQGLTARCIDTASMLQTMHLLGFLLVPGLRLAALDVASCNANHNLSVTVISQHCSGMLQVGMTISNRPMDNNILVYKYYKINSNNNTALVQSN